MPEGAVLEFSRLTKRFGRIQAVDGLTARVEPGAVTGFLGPNGAGKTTSLRMLLGLVRPTAGAVTLGGVGYARLRDPLRTVGAVLEASGFHPGRTAANHLRVCAQAAGLPAARVDEVLGLVGLADAAGRKVGGFSLGMRQRLGLAGALLGDPGVLVLDEPANGLDPEGITWLRGLLQALAGEGRTVLMSSHLLAEVAQTADRLLILSRGRLVFQGGIEDLAEVSESATVVDAPDRVALASALAEAGIGVEAMRGGLTARGVAPERIGALAAGRGIALSVLQRRGPSLEEVFFDLVDGARVHPSAQRGRDAEGGGAAPGRGGAERRRTARGGTAGSPADAERTDAATTDAEATGAEATIEENTLDEDIVAGEPARLPGEDEDDRGLRDRPTEADRAADAFFRSFDAHDGTGRP